MIALTLMDLQAKSRDELAALLVEAGIKGLTRARKKTQINALLGIKTVRKRKVFGRVKVPYGGTDCVVWLTKTEINIRPKHSRRVWRLDLEALCSVILSNSPAGEPTYMIRQREEAK